MRRLLPHLIVALTLLGPLSGASAADTFTATATPTTAGTSSAPGPEETTVDLKVETDATGTPRDAVTTYAQLLPAEFVDSTAKFGTCPRETIAKNGDGGAHPPPDCPANSVIGSGELQSVIPDLKLSTTTDKLIIYNNGGGQLTMWFHVSDPAEVSFYAPATITKGASPFGPVVTWDFTSAADGSSGFVVYLKRLLTIYSPTDGSASTPTTTGTKDRNAKKRAACVRKAKKKYKHRAKKRKAAVRKCKKRYPPKRSRSVAHAADATKVAAFESTGCANAKWPFQADVRFKKSSTPEEKLDASVDCGAAGGPSSGGGGGTPTCGLPICPVSAVRLE